MDVAALESELETIHQSYEALLTRDFFAQMQTNYEMLQPDAMRYRKLAMNELDFVRNCEVRSITTCHNVDHLLEYMLADSQLDQFDVLVSSLKDRFLAIMTIQTSHSEDFVPSSKTFNAALACCEKQVRKQYAELYPRWQRLRKYEYHEALAEIKILQNKGDVLLLPDTEWQLQLLTGTVREKTE